jgi:hypothetical protein
MRTAELLRAVLLAALPLLQGCLYVKATGAFGPVLRPEVVERIAPGVTTKREVLALLGPPEEFLRSEVIGSLGDETTRVAGAVALGNRAQDAFSWQHDVLDGRGTLTLFYNRFDAEVESDLLVVFFDDDDVVREVAFRRVSE